MSQSTKRALAAALKEELMHKPLDRITINDLTGKCGISRTTFYYHFHDIYDLAEWTCVDDARRALDGNRDYDTWQHGFLRLFEAMLANRPFIMNIYRSVSREQLETYLYKQTYDLLSAVIEEQAAGMDIREDDKRFIADFYKYGLVGLMLDWIKNGMREDPQAIISRLGLLMRGAIATALDNYRGVGSPGPC